MRIIDRNAVFKLTDQGYLVTQSTLARVGEMEYLGEEIGQQKGKVYKVGVDDAELFNPTVIKSFEGMPVTLEHPDGLVVDASNWKEHSIGHVQNVRQEGQYLKGDIYISDAKAIAEIQGNGIKELSCGYDSQLVPSKTFDFQKTQIKGNHVAIVPSGRAGASCRLGDKEKEMPKANRKTLADSLKKLLGLSKKIGDSEPMTEEEKKELEALLEELQAALDTLLAVDGSDPERVKELEAKIAELEAKLSKPKEPVNDEGPDEGEEALKKENADLKAKIEALEKELTELKAEKSKEQALGDAKARFPKVKLGDAKTARDVQNAVLVDSGVFSQADVTGKTDAEVSAAYMALAAVQRPKLTVGKTLLGDGKKQPVDLTAKFGGKK